MFNPLLPPPNIAAIQLAAEIDTFLETGVRELTLTDGEIAAALMALGIAPQAADGVDPEALYLLTR